MYFNHKEEYEKYLKKNEVTETENIVNEHQNNFFKFSEEGDILLEQSKCRKSIKNVDDYASCLGWIMLDDGKTMALLKHPFGDIYRDLSKEEYYIALYNNILMPQISRQLQNRSATYYFAKRSNRKGLKDNRRYILSLDFKGKDKEIIEGNKILSESSYETTILKIQKLIEILEDYMIENGFNMEDIERTKKDFIRQSFFNKFIKQLDEHNGNWGILIDRENNTVEMAPTYDLDCSCDISKKSKKQRICTNGGIGIHSFIEQFGQEEWFKQYLREVIQNFDIEKAFEQAKRTTNVDIPDEYKEKYKTFFAQRMQEVKDAYYELDHKEEKQEKEI